ncbi:MAG TPA: hypothetical protein VGZ71_16435 [Puia sp.]|nr:hypothetical protein [Puia sp.]
MTNFDDIQDAWNQQRGPEIRSSQPEGLILLAEKNTQKIKAKQFWTIVILGVSIFFFSWYSLVYIGFRFSWFHAGLALMFISLLLRLIIEYRSYISFRSIDIRSDFTNYKMRIIEFYRRRMKIHYLLTPIMGGAYISGFMLLLPVFKKSFSTGFYWYIVISGWILLILFTAMLIRQIKKEMKLLDFLKEVT